MTSGFEPATLSLWFLDAETPALDRASFFYDPEFGEVTSVRGRISQPAALSNSSGVNSFTWSPAVQALAVLLVRTAAQTTQEPASLSGAEGSLASSLDYALSKNTSWLSNIFGSDELGVSYGRAFLRRSNAERKRPGPVVIHVDPKILPPSNIAVHLDGQRVLNHEYLRVIADRIEHNFLDRRRTVSAVDSSEREKAIRHNLPLTHETSAEPDGLARPRAVHHFTTALDLEQEYLRGLRRRIIDRKFAFIGDEAASAWSELCESPDYAYYLDSLELIRRSAKEIGDLIGCGSNVIAVWPGTGVKEFALFEALAKRFDTSLVIVDTSTDMATLALRSIPTPVEVYMADFMQPGILTAVCERVRAQGQRRNFLLFFGHTLGSYSQGEVLQTVRSSLRSHDFVIFGVQALVGSNEREALDRFAKHYDNSAYNRQVLSALKFAGLTLDDGSAEIELQKDHFFPDIWIIQQYFRFRRSKIIRFAGEEIPFCEGERLLAGSHYCYTHAAIERILRGQGFDIIKLFSSASGAVEVLCKRT